MSSGHAVTESKQTETDFRAKGCPNYYSPDRISTCTTAYLDGIIVNINPENSWAAKWQRTGNSAVRVKGRIPEDVEADLDARGIKYRPRDRTEVDQNSPTLSVLSFSSHIVVL
ncbi:transcription elongation factor spt4 [Marasmius sp. AFHP31]|nr:transcription elongation factor spt4 [Marasmius sp. AFHP31]